jgi:hypothetical protein
MVQVRNKLSTPEAERMGVEAAREWEREQAEHNAEQEKQRRKEDFIAPLLEAGVSKRDAEEAYKQHLIQTVQAQSRA